MLQELQEFEVDISSVIALPNIEDRYERLVKEMETIRQQLEVLRRKIPAMKQYYIQRSTRKEHIDWLTEVKEVLQETRFIDNLEEAQNEMKTHATVASALSNSKASVEEAIVNTSNLDLAGSGAEIEENGASILQELWGSVQQSCLRKTEELNEAVALWTSFENDSEFVVDCLTKGEMALSRLKDLEENKPDVLRELIEKNKVSHVFLH